MSNREGFRAGAVCVGFVLLLSACGEDGPAIPDRPSYREWIKIEPEGAVCGNGTPYKFFVNYSDVSNDLVVVFEPGGACWDYESCTQKDGIRGAANVDGIPDDHVEKAFYVPFFNRDYEHNHTRDWNFVYVPYCTGDVHSGNSVATYTDEETGDEIEFHHSGHYNVQRVVEWMSEHFEYVPQMLATGCSAGGVGSTVNYYFLRNGLPGVERGYLLADSGPIFPSDGYSEPFHDKVYESWKVESFLDKIPASFDPENFGSINRVLAEEFPDDRLSVTYFRRDFIAPLYSYERFYDYPPKEEVLAMWWDDTQKLMSMYDEYENLSYYIPYWRALNDSHCSTAITFVGADIQEQDMTLGQYVTDLLDDDVELESYLESPQPGEDEPEDDEG